MGELGILNVGAGDTKLVFDKNNPQERIRAARIVTDMLRRGYALLIEIPGADGKMTTQRVTSFNEDACEYIIADFDPVAAQEADQAEAENVESEAAAAPAAEKPRGTRVRPRKTKSVPADRARGVAVAPISGG